MDEIHDNEIQDNENEINVPVNPANDRVDHKRVRAEPFRFSPCDYK